MCLDKIYTLQTGVSLEISTAILQRLTANAINQQQLSELENIRCIADLYIYLSVIIYEGAEDLIKRRHRWINHKLKKAIMTKQPIPFNTFCKLFWRNLDEDDPDGDEWQQFIASDQFYSQSTALLNKLHITERNLQQYKNILPDLNLESV